MKKIFRKNQVVIAALTLMLAIAGYLHFSGETIDLGEGTLEDETVDLTQSAFANTDEEAQNEEMLYEYSQTAGEVTIDEIGYEENIQLNSDEEDIGEAVMASTPTTSTNMINAMLMREQSRSKSKEYYMEIINNEALDEEAKKTAVDAYVKMTEDMEKEAEAEAMLNTKGFYDVFVSITDGNVDVVINQSSITDEERVQIEDIVSRKTGCSLENVTITTVGE